MAESFSTQIDAAIEDTLTSYLRAFLKLAGESATPQYGFDPMGPQGQQCPFIGIYGGDGTKLWGSAGTTTSAGYTAWSYDYNVWAFVIDKDSETSAQKAKRWADAMRACIEKYYTLGAVVADTEVGEMQTSVGVEYVGGVMQAAGFSLTVTLGRAGQTVLIA